MNLEGEYKNYGYTQYTYDNNTSLYNDYVYDAIRSPRVPTMGVTATGHRRTLSNISNNSNSIVNQGFRLDSDDIIDSTVNNLSSLQLNSNFYTSMENNFFPQNQPSRVEYENLPNNYFLKRQFVPTELSSQNLNLNNTNQFINERPISLGTLDHSRSRSSISSTSSFQSNPRLRSSLKKYNSQQQNSGPGSSSTIIIGAGDSFGLQQPDNYKSHSGNSGEVSTNPTPPESITSDDSSYLSAKDNGSISSIQSRVHFGPEILLDLPINVESLDSTGARVFTNNPEVTTASTTNSNVSTTKVQRTSHSECNHSSPSS